MIYKFKSKATGDLIMLGPNGDQMLQLLGRAPAAQGIIDVVDMGSAIDALQRAVQAEEARADQARAAADDDDAGSGKGGRGVSLRQRLWPMVEMLKRAQAAKEPVVWGV